MFNSARILLGLLLLVPHPSQGSETISEESPLLSQAESFYRSGVKNLTEDSSSDNLKTAFTILKQSADLGHAQAQNHVGYFYEMGLGVQRDPYWAYVYYKKSASQGDAQAQNNLGSLYERGMGINQNYQLATHFYALSEAQGNITARLNLAHLYEYDKVPNRSILDAVKIYQDLANKGNARAIHLMGILYMKGKGIKQDLPLATNYFQRAANMGYKRSQEKLAYLGITKENTPKNYNPKDHLSKSLNLMKENEPTEEAKVQRSIALKFLKTQATQGNMKAQFILGSIYQNGWGTEKKLESAIHNFYLAAAQGHEEAMTTLDTLAKDRARRARLELAHKGNQSIQRHFADIVLSNVPVLSEKDRDDAENAIRSLIDQLIKMDSVYVEKNSWAEGNLASTISSQSDNKALFKFTRNPQLEKLSIEISKFFEIIITSAELFLEPGTLITCLQKSPWWHLNSYIPEKLTINDSSYYCYNNYYFSSTTIDLLVRKLTLLSNLFKNAHIIIQSVGNTEELFKNIKIYELLENNDAICNFLKCYTVYLKTIDSPADQHKFLGELNEFLEQQWHQLNEHISIAKELNDDYSTLLSTTTDYRNDLFLRYIHSR